MIKHCPFCNTRFKAKPSGKKYCCYDHFVYDKYKDKTEAVRVVKRYRERSLPSLESNRLWRGEYAENIRQLKENG